MATGDPLVQIKNLKTYFFTDEGVVTSVDDVTYDIPEGKTLGLVGESGCGKSVTAMSILRLIPEPPGKIVSGSIEFEGKDLTKLSLDEIREIRGNKISMIFQEPMTSLNPVYTVGNQIVEAIQLHSNVDDEQAYEHAVDMLRKVGIPAPEVRIDEYPHQMSGGMKQRVMIAMALATNPRLLIADEPTTALDVTIRAQILELLNQLQKDSGMSILLITHDLGVIAETAHRVVVMYASKVVETAEVKELFAHPRHPYTLGLFNSIPKIDKDNDILEPIPGQVPVPLHFPAGCKFHPRCKMRETYGLTICETKEPPLRTVGDDGHQVRCWLNHEDINPGGWPL